MPENGAIVCHNNIHISLCNLWAQQFSFLNIQTLPRGCLQFVIVVFSDHTHVLFICYDCSHMEYLHPIFCAHLIIFRECWTWTLLLLHNHHLWRVYIIYVCVICNTNICHSFIFKVCIMIVHTLKMCTCDAGPEQSLVLF